MTTNRTNPNHGRALALQFNESSVKTMARLADTVELWGDPSDWTTQGSYGWNFTWRDATLTYTAGCGWQRGVEDVLFIWLAEAHPIDVTAPKTRWRELRETCGYTEAEGAKILDVTPERLVVMESGLDDGDDVLERASRLLRVSSCWLKGHDVSIPDKLVVQLSDLVAEGDVGDEDVTTVVNTVAMWAKCEVCR